MVLRMCLMLWMLSALPKTKAQLRVIVERHARWEPRAETWYVNIMCGPFEDRSRSPSLWIKSEKEPTFGSPAADTVTRLNDYRDRFFWFQATKPGRYECSVMGQNNQPESATLELDLVTLQLLFADAKLSELETRQTSCGDTWVGFCAFVNRERTYSHNDVVRFQHGYTNIGNAFNTSTGVFTVPFAGTYAFHITIFPKRNNDLPYIVVNLKVNNLLIEATLCGFDQQSSNQAVLKLTQRQRVWIENVFSNTSFLTYYTVFSGALLYAGDV